MDLRWKSQELQRLTRDILSMEYSHPYISEACAYLKISPRQLHPKELSAFQSQDITEAVQALRFQHYIHRQQARIKQVAEYLLENNLFINREGDGSHFIPGNSCTPVLISSVYINEHKRQIVQAEKNRQLKAKESFKEIRLREQLSRKELEKKLNKKYSKKVEPLSEEAKKKFQQRDQKIHSIKEGRERELRRHEMTVLSNYKDQCFFSSSGPLTYRPKQTAYSNTQ